MRGRGGFYVSAEDGDVWVDDALDLVGCGGEALGGGGEGVLVDFGGEVLDDGGGVCDLVGSEASEQLDEFFDGGALDQVGPGEGDAVLDGLGVLVVLFA